MAELKHQRKLELDDLGVIMRQDPGRRFLARLLEKSGFLDSAYDDDERRHVLAEGKREIGSWLYKELQEIDPVLVTNLIRETLDVRREQRVNRSSD